MTTRPESELTHSLSPNVTQIPEIAGSAKHTERIPFLAEIIAGSAFFVFFVVMAITAVIYKRRKARERMDESTYSTFTSIASSAASTGLSEPSSSRTARSEPTYGYFDTSQQSTRTQTLEHAYETLR